MPITTNQIILWSFWNITSIFTAGFKMLFWHFISTSYKNCRNSTKLPTPQVEYSPTFRWYIESSRWPRKGEPSIPNVTIVSIIGTNPLRFSSNSCLYFLSHNRLISWLHLWFEKNSFKCRPCWKMKALNRFMWRIIFFSFYLLFKVRNSTWSSSEGLWNWIFNLSSFSRKIMTKQNTRQALRCILTGRITKSGKKQ